jgi:tRNA(Ile)-lysidine synthetase-like protein
MRDMDLLPGFLGTMRRLDAFRDGPRRVVVGVSGGPDSLALLHLFARARAPLGVDVLAAHLDHRIRGEDAEADARYVARMAEEWGVPHHVERMNVPRLAESRGLSLEEAARQARYTMLGQAAAAFGAEVIAVGHNAGDQAETVLMHLLRGAGLAGLRGMTPVTPLSDYHLLEPAGEDMRLIRPLLGVTRAEIEAYLAARGIEPRFDRSNLDRTYFRNKLRHDVLPALEDIAPGLRERLVRTAEVLRADYEIVEAEVNRAWEAAIREETAERIAFDAGAWQALPLAIQRAVVRRAAYALRPALRDVTFEHVEGAVEIGREGETGAEATLPGGLALCVEYDAIAVAAEGVDPPAPNWPLLPPGTRIDLPGPCITTLPGGGWRFALSAYDGARSGPNWRAVLDAQWAALIDAEAAGALALRTRRPGDRIHLMGLGGSKKISEFMIDQKIPAAWRDRLPLLAAGDQVAWVCGWRVDARFAVGPESGAIWLARFVRIDEKAAP